MVALLHHDDLTREQPARPTLGPIASFLHNELTSMLATPGPAKGAFQIRQAINLHKLLVVPVYAAVLYFAGDGSPFTQSYSPAAVCLLVCHGLYGMMWVYKVRNSGGPR